MKGNVKFHAIAIAVICMVIIVLYMVIGKKPVQQAPVDPATSRSISIYSATLGANCNPLIDQALRERQNKPLTHDAKGAIVEDKLLERVKTDNVLPFLQKTCGGKLKCKVNASNEVFGLPPSSVKGCYPTLNVGYRCFSFDSITTVDVKTKDDLKIDCTETDKKVAPAAAK